MNRTFTLNIASPRRFSPAAPFLRRVLPVVASLALLAGCGGDAKQEAAPAASAGKSASAKPPAAMMNPDKAPPKGSGGSAKKAFDVAKLGEDVRKVGVREEKSALSRFAPEEAASRGGEDGAPKIASVAEFLNPTDGSAPAKLTKSEVFVEQAEMLVIDYTYVGDAIVNMRGKSEEEMKTLRIRATFELKEGAWSLSKTSKLK
jgi:hypothetical protein